MSKNSFQKEYSTSKSVVRQDKWMRHLIRIGGLGIIVSVLAIFIFILVQVLPLFFNAEVKPLAIFRTNPQSLGAIGLDEWGEIPFLATTDGRVAFFDSAKPNTQAQWISPLAGEGPWKLYRYYPDTQTLLYGDATGQARWLQLKFSPEFVEGVRTIHYDFELSPTFSLTSNQDPRIPGPEGRLLDLALGGKDGEYVLASLQAVGDNTSLNLLPLSRQESLLGEGTLEPGVRQVLLDTFPSPPVLLRINETGTALLLALTSGEVQYLVRGGEGWTQKPGFFPFKDKGDPAIASMDFLLGDASVYFTQADGTNVIFSLLIPDGESERRWVQVKQFPQLPGGGEHFVKSLRNRAFLVTSGRHASLDYGTTEKVRWEQDFTGALTGAALSKKYHRLALFEAPDRFQLFELKDPHPEGGWKAFFGKVWYEGAPKPQYVWQSSGGSDAFEPKLSLIPLIVGTFKGTLYALLFAVPIALLSAIYTSQFLEPNLKKLIKPIMEIMASLPSVILGFLAALWLAPRIENSVPSLMLVILVLPLAVLAFGALLHKLPRAWRAWIKPGREWLWLIPLLCLVSWAAWEAGPYLERLVFTVPDPQTGGVIADFRLWWTAKTGTPFEQRNSLVVGLIMGFAVIPIIFTLAEDSLSAVPNSLRSASLALGASRWQTAFRVILPAATAGIFSAIIIGFGRAVGETMIVLMATGNTPIMDFDIFTGMRTLSANLAVELPEAPFQSTLYRTLFLGALVLFLMTFGVNSIAEIMRQRIRKKFRAL